MILLDVGREPSELSSGTRRRRIDRARSDGELRFESSISKSLLIAYQSRIDMTYLQYREKAWLLRTTPYELNFHEAS